MKSCKNRSLSTLLEIKIEYMKLEPYFTNIAQPYSKNSDFYILYDNTRIGLINKNDKILNVFWVTANHIYINGIDKIAVLTSRDKIDFYNLINSDLIQSNSIKLKTDNYNIENFSINSDSTYIVYEKTSGYPHSVSLWNIRNNTEESLFTYKYE